MLLHQVTPPRWSLNFACTNPSCNERTRVTAKRLFTAMVPARHGGTQKQPGFFCSKCLRFSPVLAGTLPKGMYESLPSEKQWLETSAATLAEEFILTFSGTGWVKGEEGLKLLTNGIEAATKRGAVVAQRINGGKISRSPLNADKLRSKKMLEHLEEADCTTLGITYVDAGGCFRSFVFHQTGGAAARYA